ncbi:hypothetical protein [Candidatus Poriferisodalis sp.]|uniref:hypothetical protein n=1 Tax=Candidatus Poriferisodalis sp. TaxID=3101277 RepID=UPI003B02B3FD
MSDIDEIYVQRTCTQLAGLGGSRQTNHSMSLSDYRSEVVYILLGGPGSGKTTEFKREAESLGDAATYVTARDFVALDPEDEWRHRTLFIDGLDEIRAGTCDRRTVLDKLRNRLKTLAWPTYRLSCREADWLGSNDRQALERVTPGGAVTVLRLDALDDEAQLALSRHYLNPPVAVTAGGAAGETETACMATELPCDRETARLFLGAAEQRGLVGMLGNPLSLSLLAEAVAEENGKWPESRREIFEDACSRLAQEQPENIEQLASAVSEPVNVNGLLLAAGELCAYSLLTGIERISLISANGDLPCIALNELFSDIRRDLPSPYANVLGAADIPQLRRSALATKLFAAAYTTSADAVAPVMSPLHRHIAEFLAGRYLAQLINDGLPARRVIALMLSPSDQRVVTSLRGLSAWIAAHSTEAFDLLIDADPVGVGLYGDISGLSSCQFKKLLGALACFTAEGPLLGHEWRDSPEMGYRDNTAWAFRSMVTPATLDTIEDLLRECKTNYESNRIAQFLLSVLAEAAQDTPKVAASLEQDVLCIVSDTRCHHQTRSAALRTYLKTGKAEDGRNELLLQFLTAAENDPKSDPQGDLTGLLLGELYPHHVLPGDIWSHLRPHAVQYYYGSYTLFWKKRLIEHSSPQNAADALDALWITLNCDEGAGDVVALLRKSELPELPLELVKLALDIPNGERDQRNRGRVSTRSERTLYDGDEGNPDWERLFRWLTVATACLGHIRSLARQDLHDAISASLKQMEPQDAFALLGSDDARRVADGANDLADPTGSLRAWLEARPEIQRQLYLLWLRWRAEQYSAPNAQHFWALSVPMPLFDSTLPRDLGVWCLEQAIALEASDQQFAALLLKHIMRYQINDADINENLSLELIRTEVSGSLVLRAVFEDLMEAPEIDPHLAEQEARVQAARLKREEEQGTLRQQWTDYIRANLETLRAGSFPVHQLDYLASVYLGYHRNTGQYSSGGERLAAFLQNDRQLAATVCDAFTVAVLSAELPTVRETITLNAERRRAFVTWPLFAGLQIVEAEGKDCLADFDDERKRRILASCFCVAQSLVRTPTWLEPWVQTDPSLVADVLVQCIRGDVLAGQESSFALHWLDLLDFDATTEYQIRLRVLRSFPTTAPRRQLRLLDQLLLAVVNAGSGCRTNETIDIVTTRDVLDAKLASTSMTVSQRARWLMAAVLLFECHYLDQLVTYVVGNPGSASARKRSLVEFLYAEEVAPRWTSEPHFSNALLPCTLATLVEVLGSEFAPAGTKYRVGLSTVDSEAEDWIAGFIAQLGDIPAPEATNNLQELLQNPELEAWQDHLRRATETQRTLRRDAEYQPPTLEVVQQTLSNGLPANAGDLASLLVDRLDDIAGRLRGDPSNPWRSFWNEDQYGRIFDGMDDRNFDAKVEDACRDVLMQMLRAEGLAREIDLGREGNYAADTRADLRVSYGGFNVPIEIKRHSHRNLWSAIRRQLIEKYTTDPASDGYGIYLVLWFDSNGKMRVPVPASGKLPRTSSELQAMLEASLSDDERRRIFVRVLDVTKPRS